MCADKARMQQQSTTSQAGHLATAQMRSDGSSHYLMTSGVLASSGFLSSRSLIKRGNLQDVACETRDTQIVLGQGLALRSATGFMAVAS